MRLIQRVYDDFGLELRGEAVDAAREVHRRDRDVGSTPRRRSSSALDALGQAYTLNAGDGAFYGPKIDFDITDAHRPQVAVRHDSARLPDARSAST